MEHVDDVIHIAKIMTVSHQQLINYITVANEYENESEDDVVIETSFMRHQIREYNYNRFIHKSDRACRDMTRMDKRTFQILCDLLQTKGGLTYTKWVCVEEMVAMFLQIVAHDMKNRVISAQYARSGETVSRHFHEVLRSILKCDDVLLKKPEPITSDCTDNRWKWFENCIGALDGTYIDVKVSAADKASYRTRKGTISTNVLAACSPGAEFTFVMAGWEGSAADSRVLRDAIFRPDGLKVPRGTYYLCDAGYPNAEGFLTPYRGERYHLSEWRGAGNAPTTTREFYNMKHSSARNVIERAFGVLKNRWAILRKNSYYPVEVKSDIILACCYLHNLITREMGISTLDEFDEIETMSTTSQGENIEDDNIQFVETSDEWTLFREMLGMQMFSAWEQS